MDKICTWIGPDAEGCTHTTVEGRSYCEEHLWQVYQKGTRLGRRKKDQARVDRIRLWTQLMDEAIAELEAEGETLHPGIDQERLEF